MEYSEQWRTHLVDPLAHALLGLDEVLERGVGPVRRLLRLAQLSRQSYSHKSQVSPSSTFLTQETSGPPAKATSGPLKCLPMANTDRHMLNENVIESPPCHWSRLTAS
jgi:hypothetical protein